MAAAEDPLSSLGLDPLIGELHFRRNPASGILATHAGHRTVCASPEFTAALRLVLDRERPGAWAAMMKAGGYFCGKGLAAGLDARLAALGKPMLAGLPLETCLIFIESYFAQHGLGRLQLDLTHAAEHGVVVAKLQNSFFAAALAAPNVFADPMPAGLLQGFFEHISGQVLGCEEIGCVRHGASHCTFVVTAPERLTSVASLAGRETAAAIITRLCN